MVTVKDMLQQSRLLLTGATGPFGIAILSYINDIAPKCQITVITRDSQKAKEKLKGITKLIIDYIEIDFENCCEDAYKLIPRNDYVIHMASVTAEESFNDIDPISKYRVLDRGAQLITSYCMHYNAKKILFTSSGAVYGEQDQIGPIKETDRCYVDIEDPRVYALPLGKLSAEFAMSYIDKFTSTKACICRCFGFCGPGIPVDLHYAIGNFVQCALLGEDITIKSDGLSLRSYMDTRDLAHWIITLLFKETKYLIYNVGSDRSISIRRLAELAKEATSSSSRILVMNSDNSRLSNPRAMSYVPSIERARSEGLELVFHVEDSIANYAKWVTSCAQH
jgi:nucleoside-diphosphate-sugar epimerase